MQCPVCTDETLVISSREGIEIDHCPQCRGVWLDRDRQYRPDRRHDRKRKAKSFLEEIFDFD